MFSQLAQAYNYNYTSPTVNASSHISGALVGLLSLVALVVGIFMIVCMWKVFVKAGEAGWKSIVPVYNLWILAELVGRPGWWGLLIGLSGFVVLIPVLGWLAYIAALVLYVMIYLDLAKAFGKSTGFGILLILLPIVGLPMLAFGSDKYVGKRYQTNATGVKPTATPPATPPADTPPASK